MRPLHNPISLEKMICFSEILDLSEPTYARHLIGGEQKTKDRKTSIFNEGIGLCRGLSIRREFASCDQEGKNPTRESVFIAFSMKLS